MTYVISDLHGVPLRQLKELLKKAVFSDEDVLFVLGDTLDRGADGIALLCWMMEQPNVFHLLGNHEAMLLAVSGVLFKDCGDVEVEDFRNGEMEILSTMLLNGAQPTLDALKTLYRKDPALVGDLLDYLREMPLFDSVDVGETTYVLTHAGLGHFAPGKRLSAYAPDDLLWHRPGPDETYPLGDDVKVIFGHTPTSYYGRKGQIVQTDTWCCIDTSDAAPTLLRLDDWMLWRPE